MSLNSCQKLSAFPPVEEWNAELLFRDITQLTQDDIKAQSLPEPIARRVLLEARRERERTKEVNEHAHRPGVTPSRGATGTAPFRPQKVQRLQYDDAPKTWICPHCKDCPELEKCIVRRKAQERSVADIAKMTGALLSCSETTDVLGYKCMYSTPSKP